jgi:DNA-binding transcriptional ArsR family regulator
MQSSKTSIRQSKPRLIRGGEYSVSEISDETEISQPTVSQHLRKMRDHGVVTKRDAGLNNSDSLADEQIADGMETMREVLLDKLAGSAAVSEQTD